VRFLLDTHLLLWTATDPDRLSRRARALIEDEAHQMFFSVASLWEIAIKSSIPRSGFWVDTALLRQGLSDHGFQEIPIEAEHAIAVAGLPRLHRDPFDRMLVAQAVTEGLTLLTSDRLLAAYPTAIKRV
jgi:PIN domain nuclease of toxin-antitoxin system